jgi:hypothetical protein
MNTRYWWKTRKGSGHSEDLWLDRMAKKQNGMVWSGLIWLRIRNNDGGFANTPMNIQIPLNGNVLPC